MTKTDDKHEGHEGIEARSVATVTRSRTRDAPDDRMRDCSASRMGPGVLESIYRVALCLELDASGLAFERERPVRVTYRGTEIPGRAVARLSDVCTARC